MSTFFRRLFKRYKKQKLLHCANSLSGISSGYTSLSGIKTMLLVILTALTAVCGAAKLDKTYLPPITAKTAGGSPGALQAPFRGSIQGLELPTGSYTNDAQGVVVDAVNPGTRTSGDEPTGLGGPRASYGSTNSKVGDAAFKASFESPGGSSTRIAPGFGSFVDSDDSGNSKTRGSNLKFSTDVVSDNYSYGFETDNGITVGENGVAINGVQAQGGYSYKGDDGKKYEVTYTADEGGYKPQGQHLPTPPPIPVEILKSLEKNAKEEAAGLSDDGSYDAQKYNDEGDYSSNGAAFNNARPTIGGGDATASGLFVNQGNQAYRPSSGVLIGDYNPGGAASHSSHGHGAQGFGQASGNKQSGFGLNQGGVSGETVSIGGKYGKTGSKNKFGSQGKFGASSQFVSQSSFNSQSTESRFGVQSNSPDGTQTYNNLSESPKENSSFSSAVSSGSGSATAFASTSSNGFKNQYIPPTNNFGSAGQYDHSSKTDSLVGASFPAPSTASASASFSGTPTFSQQYSGSQQSSAQLSPTAAAPSYNKFGSSYSQSGQLGQIGVTNESSGQSGFQIQKGNNEISTSVGQNQIGSTIVPFSGVQPTRPTFGFGSLSSQGPSKVPDTELTTPFESNDPVSAFNHQTSNQELNSINTPASSATLESSFLASQQGHQSGSVFPSQSEFPSKGASGQYKPQNLQGSFSQTGPTDATFASSSQKPALSQQQGSDNSYYYKQPSKPFVTPSPSFSSQLVNNNQQTAPVSSLSQEQSKYPTAPTPSTTGQYQSSSYNSGVTQAAISPFSSSSSGSFGSQSSQFGLKPTPSTQFGQSSQLTAAQQTLSQKPSFQLGQKPIVDSQTQFGEASSSQSYDSSLSPTQQYQGTVYQYNKPAETLPAPDTDSQAKPSQILTDSKFESHQTTTQFSSQLFGNPSSILQQTQTAQGSASGSQSNNLFGQKPQTSQGGIASSAVSQGQFTQTSHFGQKPFTSSQTTGTNYQQSQLGGSGSPFSQNLPTALGSTFSSNKENQQSVFHKKPATSTQSVFSSSSAVTQKPYSFGQKPFGSSQFTGYQQTNYGSTAFTVGQKPQSSSITSNTLSQGQVSQLGTKPSSFPNQAFQKPQFGTANSQSVQSNGLVSTTGQSFGQKPISSFNQLSQFGSSSFTSNTGSKGQSAPNSQFGVTGSSQNTQSVQGSGSAFTAGQTSFGQKPTNAFSQQSQFGLSSSSFTSNTGSKGQSVPNSQFGVTGSSQNTKPVQGSGSALNAGQTSFAQKPTNAFNQQSQFGSSFTSNSGTKGQSAPNSQFAVTGSSQNTQSVQGSGSAFTAGQTSFGQKPTNTFNQQSQFGSGSSSLTPNTNSKGQSVPNSQFGVTGSSPNTQSVQGGGSALTASQTSFGQKPTNAFNQQSQFGSSFTSNTGSKGQSAPYSGVTGSSQNTQSVQGSGSAFTAGQTSFAQKPTNAFNQQTQFGTSSSSFTSNTGIKGQSAPNSQFGVPGSSQNTQSVQGSGSAFIAGQTSFGQKPTNAFNQQSQFGSSSSSFTPNTGSKGQSAPNSQFGVTGSSQNIQSVQGSGSAFTAGQTSFGQKPTNAFNQQSQFGSSSSSFTPNTGSKGQSAPNSQFGVTGSSQNTQSVQGSGSAFIAGQTSFGQKPTNAFNQQSQFGSSSSSFTPNTGSKGQSAPNSQFGVTGSSQNTQSVQGSGSAFTAGQTSFGQKPTNAFNQQSQFGSSFTSNLGAKGQSTPNSQFGVTGSSQNTQSVQGSGLALTAGQTSFGHKPTNAFNQQSQFGSSSPSFTLNTGSKGQSAPYSQFGVTGSSQNTQSVQGSGLAFTAGQTSFAQKPTNAFNQQTQFGTSSSSFTSNTGIKGQTAPNSQFGVPGSSQNTQSVQGSSSAFTAGQTSFGQKPTNAFNQQSQFGSGSSSFTSNTGIKGQSASNSQFGVNGLSQNTPSAQGSGLTSTTGQTSFGQKPTNAFNQQSQFGSSFTSNLGAKGQSAPNSQFGVTGSSQNTQSVQSSGSALTAGQTSFGQKPTNAFNQQSQFGSSFTSNSGTKDQAAQNSQFGLTGTSQTSFGQKPVSSFQQSAFGGSTNSNKFSQTQSSQYDKKPSTTQSGSNFQLSGLGNTSTSQTGQSAGSNYQQFGSTNSVFGQKPQLTQESSLPSKGQSVQTSQFGVTGLSQNTHSVQGGGLTSTTGQTSFGQKPTYAFNQQSQFGSSFTSNSGTKDQAAQNSQFGLTGTSQTSFGQKPVSSFQQSAFGGSTNSNKFSQTQSSQYDKKPSTTQSGSNFQLSGLGNTSTSQTGQSAGSNYQQFGSTNSVFGQKPQLTQESSLPSKGQSVQTSQFGVTGSSQNTGSSSSFGSGSSYQQTQFSSSSGSQFDQKPQTASGTVSQQSTQFGVKPFNQKPFVISQTSGSSYEKNQFGTSGSLFGQKPLTIQTAQKPSSTFGSYTQTTQFGTQTKKPFGSTQTPFLSQFSSTTGQYVQKPLAQANAFASGSTYSNKFGSTQLNQGSKYQQPSQFGSFGQKPIVSSLSQTNYQQTQYTQTSGSQPQVGQASQFSLGSGQFGSQSSFGSSSQTTYQQTQFSQGQKPFGASQGSGFQMNQSAGDQKTQPTQSSIQTTTGGIQSESGDGYAYNKPQTAFNFASQFGSQANGPQDQKVQSTQTSLNSKVSTSQIGTEPIKPFGSSSSQSFLQNAQSSLGSGVKPTKPTDSGISTSQSSLPQFNGQPFKPASTVPSYQSETSAVSSSQFGLQPTKTPETVPFSGQPFQPSSTQSPSNLGSLSPLGSGSQLGLQSLQGVAVTTQKPSQSQFSIEPFKTNEFSSTAPSLPSRLGSDLSSKPDGIAVSTLQTTIVPVPGYEINASYQGEQFGGPRDPPRFDENTGYHY